MKTLILGRHAKSDWSLALPDIERPLNKRGRKDAPRMGKAISSLGVTADLIWTSPAVRAQTTAEAIAKEIGYKLDLLIDSRIYLASPETLISVLRETPSEAENIMLFGHNPGLELLSAMLLGISGGVHFPTGAVMSIEFPFQNWVDISPASGRLNWHVIPRLFNNQG